MSLRGVFEQGCLQHVKSADICGAPRVPQNVGSPNTVTGEHPSGKRRHAPHEADNLRFVRTHSAS